MVDEQQTQPFHLHLIQLHGQLVRRHLLRNKLHRKYNLLEDLAAKVEVLEQSQ